MSNHPSLPKKSLGQHWLNDTKTLDNICQLAEVEASDTVLEIGPGTGNLTKVILDKGAKLIALEIDGTLVEQLRSYTPNNSNLTVEQGDIRHYDLSKLPVDYKIVANIPYYLTANLLRILVDGSNKPKTTVLLVQKEVAHRVAATPGNMSFISLAVQFYYDVSLGSVVPAKLFTPPPKIDSQILVLKRLAKPALTDVDVQKFLHLGKAGFAQPRKTLVNNLSGSLHINKFDSEQLVKTAGLATNIRAQELSITNWHNLYNAL